MNVNMQGGPEQRDKTDTGSINVISKSLKIHDHQLDAIT